MTERAPSSVLKWLDQVEVPQSVLDLEQSSDEAATPLGDSLENLLCKDEFANCGIPECMPLPESRSSLSTDSHDSRNSVQVSYSQSDEGESTDSLEILGRCDTPIIPSHIQLPVSRPSSTARERREKKDASRRQSRKKSVPSLSYEEMLQRAADAFDHIKSGNVLRNSRINKTNIIYYDYWNDHMSNPIEVGNSKNATQLHIIPPDVKQRVILVEDLSRDTIHALGSAFRINPDFFEEHLLDSGYSGAQYHDPPARTWKTAPLKKSHVSIKWFRPVHRLPALFSSRDRMDLLNGQLEHAVGRSTIRTRAKTNIFRSEWDLWTDPRRSARSRRECGLEERATIWSRKMEDTNCQVVVMLLDPLPLISEKETWTLQAAESNGSADAGNIDSDEEEDNYDDDEADYGDSYDGHDDDSHRAVILEPSESDEVDVLDEGVLHMLYEGDNTIEPQRVSADPTLWNRFFISFQSRGKRKTLSKTEQRVLVEQMAPRKAMTADLDEAFGTTNLLEVLRRELNETRSTRTEICDMIDTSSQPVGLGKPIFEIIRQDTSTLLQLLHHILGEMEVDTLDDNKMEDRLALWRQLIGRARRELPELKDSIKSFLAFFDVLCPPVTSLSTGGNHPNFTKDLHDLSVAIDEMLDRLQKASESLTSNMALLESRRSIDEAHAVTRLTELAFIFVPLSFAASVFGMQVEPFADPVPLWNFFLVAVIVTSFAYMMRITTRSQWLGYVKLAVKKDIRQYAEQNGLPVQVRTLPVLLLLRWAGSLVYGGIRGASTWAIQQGRRAAKQIWDTMGFLISLCLLIGLVAVIPISVLWTRKLDHMQVGVTIAILLIAALIVGIPYCYTADPVFCYALPRLIVRAFRRIPKSIVRLSLWLFTLVAIIVVPLALIWTHPLASGIRAGLTAAIVIVVIMGIVTFRLITYYG